MIVLVLMPDLDIVATLFLPLNIMIIRKDVIYNCNEDIILLQ